ncbi:hypothetical protein TSUD_38990 [Trifolium subterraneum]|uniref:Uncharacterized protein n=1 Tax=Trifolium subterraneum TaxID=3900 RepID=A0A2Z6N3P8_TRISU|nr:hypothetical protein TSUD_38990 [Trifolium subterraneum]
MDRKKNNSNDFFSYFRFEESGDSEIPNYEGSGVNEHDESWCDDDEKRSEDEEEADFAWHLDSFIEI